MKRLKFLFLHFLEYLLRKPVTLLPLLFLIIYFIFYFASSSHINIDSMGPTYFLFYLAYLIVFSSNNFYEKINRENLELLLAKPFSRRDILAADFLANFVYFFLLVTAVGMCIAIAGEVLSFNYWKNVIPFVVSFCIIFITLYSYLQLTIVLTKNAAISTVIWIIYVLIVSISLEMRDITFPSLQQNHFGRVFLDICYYSLPQIFGIKKAISSHATYLPILISVAQFFVVSFLTVRVFEKQTLS